ncbi:MAG: arginine--tRNA ligase [Ignavibacteriales bacterium]|nr:arginine--tRNA ligase [Ignavibacteriales bacterium]MCF8307146.1 arginine--tRNA ligase [Ignavibacteriales bacterium]MCF8316804.1 arginine--tRNA ligase [Ignavibacteriales bacterium]MCF8438380.1 arginine--tRNA ligase [Ignavibacteriales bacterium]
MKTYLQQIFQDAAGRLEYLKEAEIIFAPPQTKEHGDLATNAALILSKKAGKKPRDVAAEIISNLNYDQTKISRIEIAGPGFINFFFTTGYLAEVVPDILEREENFGRSDKYAGKKALVEFVSANPTGPLTVGHGRNAVIGDTTAALLSSVGYTVEREYYFNNAGRQMRVLGDSVRHRYLQLLGEKIEYPEGYYQGGYITDIARGLMDKHGEALRNEEPEGIFKSTAESAIFSEIKRSLEKLNIGFDSYFNENSLYEDGSIKQLLDSFKESGLSYEKDGAVWLKLEQMGSPKDPVIVKSTGEPTYRLPDIAYHRNKFNRGYDLIVDIFGSDHQDQYPDVLAGLRALGYDDSKVRVLIYQFVTILEDGKEIKMSTRLANFVELEEITDAVGKDVVRYFFIRRNTNSHMSFDLTLAKRQSDENPVFYIKYAHARICSILRYAAEQNIGLSLENLHLLEHPAEKELLKKLWAYEEEMLQCAENFEPHKITVYIEELAALFHRFFTECRIIGSGAELASARIALITAVRQVIYNTLTLLGLEAPERM